jgi:hypothetical protein
MLLTANYVIRLARSAFQIQAIRRSGRCPASLSGSGSRSVLASCDLLALQAVRQVRWAWRQCRRAGCGPERDYGDVCQHLAHCDRDDSMSRPERKAGDSEGRLTVCGTHDVLAGIA